MRIKKRQDFLSIIEEEENSSSESYDESKEKIPIPIEQSEQVPELIATARFSNK